MTYTGKNLIARGTKPLIEYRHIFKATYFYGSYSSINGDRFDREINEVDSAILESYLDYFSTYNLKEFKIEVIDNAKFHSTQNISVPENMHLLSMPP